MRKEGNRRQLGKILTRDRHLQIDFPEIDLPECDKILIKGPRNSDTVGPGSIPDPAENPYCISRVVEAR